MIIMIAVNFGFLAQNSHSMQSELQGVIRTQRAMGTELTLKVLGHSEKDSLLLSEEIFQEVKQVEMRLSTWRDDSELVKFNRVKAGEGFSFSKETEEDLNRVFQLAQSTEGAFSPTLMPLVRAWDLRTFPAEKRKTPTAEEIKNATQASRAENIAGPKVWTRLHAESGLEEGGFAKGLALDRAFDRVKGRADKLVINFGGQVLIYSHKPIEVDVGSPDKSRKPVLRLELKEGSLSSTGSSERGFHVVDPSTGKLSRLFDGAGSVTVWAPDATTADVFSTALYVLGARKSKNAGAEILSIARRLNVEAIVLDSSQKKIFVTKNVKPKIRWKHPGWKLL